MKHQEFIVLGLAGLAVWLIVKSSGRASAPAVRGANFSPTPVASDAGFGNIVATWEGWRYYDSGYGKDPAGNIYYQGSRV